MPGTCASCGAALTPDKPFCAACGVSGRHHPACVYASAEPGCPCWRLRVFAGTDAGTRRSRFHAIAATDVALGLRVYASGAAAPDSNPGATDIHAGSTTSSCCRACIHARAKRNTGGECTGLFCDSAVRGSCFYASRGASRQIRQHRSQDCSRDRRHLRLPWPRRRDFGFVVWRVSRAIHLNGSRWPGDDANSRRLNYHQPVDDLHRYRTWG